MTGSNPSTLMEGLEQTHY